MAYYGYEGTGLSGTHYLAKQVNDQLDCIKMCMEENECVSVSLGGIATGMWNTTMEAYWKECLLDFKCKTISFGDGTCWLLANNGLKHTFNI